MLSGIREILIITTPEDKLTYEDMMISQIKDSIKLKGDPDLQSLINGQETWEVK